MDAQVPTVTRRFMPSPFLAVSLSLPDLSGPPGLGRTPPRLRVPLSPRLLLVIELAASFASTADARKLGGLVRGCRSSVALWRLIGSTEPLDRRTHLMHAALIGDTPRVRFLLANGSRINASSPPSDGSRTAVWIAADAGHDFNAVCALLHSGANASHVSRAPPDPAAPYNRGDAFTTPLERAAFRGHLLITRALIPVSPHHAQSRALHSSLLQRHTALVQEFANSRSPLDLCDGEGRTPVSIAAAMGSFEAISILCAAGARTDTPDSGGILPLAEAARSGHEKCVLALLDKGASIDARCGPAGRSALWWAACAGKKTIAEMLILRGADTETPATLGLTPLAVALVLKAPEVAAAIRAAVAERTTGSTGWRPGGYHRQ
jgi:ankyrin repeat protein